MAAARPLRGLAGRTVVVTGGTGGLGYWATEQLAAAGASVVIAARTPEKGAAALASLARRVPGSDARFVRLDLADLASVAEAAEELAGLPRIDALIANAGVLSSKGRQQTADGFEMMVGTNLLGHFALIGRLLPALSAPAGQDHPARIVHLGSISHEFFRLDLDDLQATSGRFREFRTYGRSKLAVMTYGFELDRRLRLAGSTVSSIVAHPGFAVDELSPHRDILPAPKQGTPVIRAAYRLVGQGKDAGAWPLVAAAVDARAEGGQYWGPDGWRQLKGAPSVVDAKPYARDPAIGRALWAAAEHLTGVSPDLPG
ncbi:SDR family NAD(P)-dependent oxidoreductase [Herbiconiux sp. CPCC 203407]|uniref:SDR family NAD(P)-dependent oxidoreductase n=1 Tax=Herbiconiux oxytropis TaxID=2970915 RepID=A0AA41XDI6_9MICO|nr:SDR family NAD(P)-dependent oxidoreductase [Herbiconiux oxytropis]MCS5721335.1 SDR family NAD(P)-dependent oxidoreductase [Herbiconiux oxytropis]MCS5726226.1 SDR family NAD(P)-dependent oxidoreductase [Herbiconiux oxytropis]